MDVNHDNKMPNDANALRIRCGAYVVSRGETMRLNVSNRHNVLKRTRMLLAIIHIQIYLLNYLTLDLPTTWTVEYHNKIRRVETISTKSITKARQNHHVTLKL